MSRFQFAISSGPESVRQAGVVESDSFSDAVVLLGEKIQVRVYLVLERCVGSTSRHMRHQTVHEHAKPRHDRSSSSRVIIATVRAQRSVSTAICFRPLRVIA